MDEQELEKMVDRIGLAQVLWHLEAICYEKAEHIRTNWQDEPLAKLWERLAPKIRRVANKADETLP